MSRSSERCPPAPCPVCGASGAFAFEDNGYAHDRCAACEVLFVAHPPPPDAVLAQYAQASGQTYHRGADVELGEVHRLEARRRLSVLGRWLPRPPGRFLEIGCGGGAFLAEMRARGWQVEGLELSPLLVEHARSTWGITVRHDTLASAGYPGGAFDAVGLFEVLSHLRDARSDLREIARVVRPGGVVVLETGNGGELSRDQMPRWGAPEHLSHFSERGVRKLLDSAGFTVLGVLRRALRFQRLALRAIGKLRGKGGAPSPPAPNASAPAAGRSRLRVLLARALLAARYDLGRLQAGPGTPCTLLVSARRRA